MQSVLNADTLRLTVRDHFRECAAEYGLEAEVLEVTYVLNWGGFVNYSYQLTDGKQSYHLKLAVDDDGRSALRRWYMLHDRLAPYHAPPVGGWVELQRAAGILFEVVPGAAPSLQPVVVEAIVPTLAGLFTDDVLANALREDGPTRSARDAYLDAFHRRFTEDLRGIVAAPPPFVRTSVVTWMEREVDRLHDAIVASTAFDEPLTGAVHGDLWLNNIHWVDAREWYLLDWDDLGIGDPAADVAALLGPTAQDLRPLKLIESAQSALTSIQQARLPLLGRATLLDWVIDPLADWLEATVSGAHLTSVRAEKERVHHEALAQYRLQYGLT